MDLGVVDELVFFYFSLEVCTNPETAKKKGGVKGEGHAMGPGDAESKQEVLNIVHTIGPMTARLLFLETSSGAS